MGCRTNGVCDTQASLVTRTEPTVPHPPTPSENINKLSYSTFLFFLGHLSRFFVTYQSTLQLDDNFVGDILHLSSVSTYQGNVDTASKDWVRPDADTL